MTQLTNSRIAWFNGKFMPENQVLIPFRDRSWRYGDGAFDMTRTFHGRAFRLKEHIDRFYRSLRYLRLDPGMSPQQMIDVSEQLVVCNEHLRAAAGDWWVGQRVSRGVDPLDDEGPGTRARTSSWNARRSRSRHVRVNSATVSMYGRRPSVASRRTCLSRAQRRTTT